MDRRAFIKKGALGALTIPLFAEDLSQVFGQTSGGKPILSISSLNGFFQKLPSLSPDRARGLLTAARQNLEGFLLDQFTVNPKQLEIFRKSYGPQKAQYDEFLRRFLEEFGQKRQLTPPRASFDPKISNYVRLSGFGMELNACLNEKNIALRRFNIKLPNGANCQARDCEWQLECDALNLQCVMQCGPLP